MLPHSKALRAFSSPVLRRRCMGACAERLRLEAGGAVRKKSDLAGKAEPFPGVSTFFVPRTRLSQMRAQTTSTARRIYVQVTKRSSIPPLSWKGVPIRCGVEWQDSGLETAHTPCRASTRGWFDTEGGQIVTGRVPPNDFQVEDEDAVQYRHQ